MTIDLTVPSYLILGIVAYYGLLFALSLRAVVPAGGGDGPPPMFVVLVPARNEVLVLADTLANLTSLDRPDRIRVLVVDDGSTDGTEAIIAAVVRTDPRVRALRRPPEHSGTGKSDVLNEGYRAVRSWCRAGDGWLGGTRVEEIVLAIVDADGRLEPGVVGALAPYFGDRRVGSVQIAVEIANAGASTLARMQDIEFVGFSCLVQVARDRIGSSGLGGNGQFTRLVALTGLGDAPWSSGALTEDLDLGLKLVEAGWRTRFCRETVVGQQGLRQWRPLLRQRTRWTQGHYQCWSHVWPLARARDVPLVARIDLIAYLLLVVTVLLVSLTMLVTVLAAVGLVSVTDGFLAFLPEGPAKRAVSLVLSVLPLAIFMATYQRYGRRPFAWFELPAFGLLFTAYTYVWFWTTLRAFTRMLLRRGSWVKTPRVAD